jgi:hypothetical protein
MGETRNAYRILIGKKKLGRPRLTWEVNIKMDNREIGWCGVDWINLAEDRDQWQAFVNMILNFKVP